MAGQAEFGRLDVLASEIQRVAASSVRPAAVRAHYIEPNVFQAGRNPERAAPHPWDAENRPRLCPPSASRVKAYDGRQHHLHDQDHLRFARRSD